MSRHGPRFHTFDPDSRFLSYLESRGDCLFWTGCTRGGYGRFYVTVSPKVRRYVAAHRYAWERANGPIPEGMQVDHVCHNRACVNVDHLRLATHSQNRAYLQGARANNRTTGIRGVHPKGKGFRAAVQKDGVCHRSATFADIESAAAWADDKRRELFGKFAGRG